MKNLSDVKIFFQIFNCKSIYIDYTYNYSYRKSSLLIVMQIEAQNYGKLTISWDNSILPSYCALKTSKYVSVCWPR